jgi:hypothetical protein
MTHLANSKESPACFKITKWNLGQAIKELGFWGHSSGTERLGCLSGIGIVLFLDSADFFGGRNSNFEFVLCPCICYDFPVVDPFSELNVSKEVSKDVVVFLQIDWAQVGRYLETLA